MYSNSTELIQYLDMIEKYSRLEIDYDIPNGNEDHAFISMRALIVKAKKSINIVSNYFDYGFWIKLKNNLIEFINKEESKLRIITIFSSEKNKILKSLNKFENVEIYQNSGNEEKEIPNYLSIDKLGYRFEKYQKEEDEKDNLITGRINFGDVIFTEKLNEYTEKIIRHKTTAKVE